MITKLISAFTAVVLAVSPMTVINRNNCGKMTVKQYNEKAHTFYCGFLNDKNLKNYYALDLNGDGIDEMIVSKQDSNEDSCDITICTVSNFKKGTVKSTNIYSTTSPAYISGNEIAVFDEDDISASASYIGLDENSNFIIREYLKETSGNNNDEYVYTRTENGRTEDISEEEFSAAFCRPPKAISFKEYTDSIEGQSNLFPLESFEEFTDSLFNICDDGQFSEENKEKDRSERQHNKDRSDKSRVMMTDFDSDGNYELLYINTDGDHYIYSGLVSYDRDGSRVIWVENDLLDIPWDGETGTVKMMTARIGKTPCVICKCTRDDSYILEKVKKTYEEYGYYGSALPNTVYTLVYYDDAGKRVEASYVKHYVFDDNGNPQGFSYSYTPMSNGGDYRVLTREEFESFERSITKIDSFSYGADDSKSSSLTDAYEYIESFAAKVNAANGTKIEKVPSLWSDESFAGMKYKTLDEPLLNCVSFKLEYYIDLHSGDGSGERTVWIQNSDGDFIKAATFSFKNGDYYSHEIVLSEPTDIYGFSVTREGDGHASYNINEEIKSAVIIY